MGLKDLNRKQFKKFQEFLAFFELLGVSEEDLRRIPKIKECLDNIKVANKSFELSKDEQTAITEKYQNAMTPEQITAMFSKDLQEFYPDGRKPKQGNN